MTKLRKAYQHNVAVYYYNIKIMLIVYSLDQYVSLSWSI